MPEDGGLSPPASEAGRGIDPLVGLSPAEVGERVAAGRTNARIAAPTRTLAQILRANVLTRFNAILGALFIVVLVVGPIQDGLFGLVLVLNTTIGVGQELRAKWTLDHLALLNAGSAHVVRGGVTQELGAEAVVVDDVLEIRAGDQVVADGEVVRAETVEIDESLLTGESEPVGKEPGDEVLSGSVVVSGAARIRVLRVGTQAFAQRIQGDARAIQPRQVGAPTGYEPAAPLDHVGDGAGRGPARHQPDRPQWGGD